MKNINKNITYPKNMKEAAEISWTLNLKLSLGKLKFESEYRRGKK